MLPLSVRQTFVILLIFISTFVLYQKCWNNPFVLDDLTKIQQNTDLRTAFAIENFVYPYSENSMHFRNDPSRPLTYILYWLCWQLGEGQPKPFHILSTGLHALSGALVAVFTAELTLIFFGVFSMLAGVGAAGLFITSPMLAGTVIYPFGLSDVLCSVFLLGILTLLTPSDHPSRTRLILACTLYVLALMSKQSGIVAPALVLAIDFFTGKIKDPIRRRRVYIPLFVMSGIYLALRYFYFGGIGDLEGRNETLPILTYAATQGLMILKYLWHTVVAIGLSIDHRELPDAYPLWQYLLFWLTVAATSGLAIRARWSQSANAKLLSLGWLFFLLCLLPTSSVFPTVDLFVERRAYFADVGIFITAGGILWNLARRSPSWRYALTILMVLAIGAQSAMALRQIQIYASSEQLWQESLALDPENPRALINLGVYYSSVERFEESRQFLERILKQQPNNGAVWSKIAYIYHSKKYEHHDDDLALRLYLKSIELNPENIFALYNVGVFMMEHDRFAEAEDYFLRAVKLSPQMGYALTAAGQAALAQKKTAKAIEYFRQSLKVNPTQELPRNYLKQLGTEP